MPSIMGHQGKAGQSRHELARHTHRSGCNVNVGQHHGWARLWRGQHPARRAGGMRLGTPHLGEPLSAGSSLSEGIASLHVGQTLRHAQGLWGVSPCGGLSPPRVGGPLRVRRGVEGGGGEKGGQALGRLCLL